MKKVYQCQRNTDLHWIYQFLLKIRPKSNTTARIINKLDRKRDQVGMDQKEGSRLGIGPKQSIEKKTTTNIRPRKDNSNQDGRIRSHHDGGYSPETTTTEVHIT